MPSVMILSKQLQTIFNCAQLHANMKCMKLMLRYIMVKCD
uniref:Uncharacterized protein n=1 Tax=Rhizophora mucronata TaxID=61149 RepID=A0A2P2PC88_RHIMU